MATLKEITDAITADIESAVDLPAHRVWKYVEPSTLRADLAPWLACWPLRGRVSPLTTGPDHEQADYFVVMWAKPAMAAAEGEASLQAAEDLDTVDAIVNRAESWLVGIPGAGHTAEVVDTRYPVDDLMWKGIVVVKVERL